MKKILVIAVILIIVMFSTTVYAFDLGATITGARTFIAHAISYAYLADFRELIKSLSNAGMAIGTIIAIAVGIVIAIRLMANGAEGKAQMKEILTPYIIGCVLLFGSYGVWAATINIFQGLDDTSGISVKPYVPPEIKQYIANNPAGGGGAGGGGAGGGGAGGGGSTPIVGLPQTESEKMNNLLSWAQSRVGCSYNQDLRTKGSTYDTEINLSNKSNCVFDCSSFVQRGYSAIYGIYIGSTTSTQIDNSNVKSVPGLPNKSTVNSLSNAQVDLLKPGDLIFSYSGHVQLYIGKVSGVPTVIHASGKKTGVKISAVGKVWAVRRVVNY